MPPTIRSVIQSDASDAVAVLRDSITELCVDDHRNDAATLQRWLRNKTVNTFRDWLADEMNHIVVAEANGEMLGAGMIQTTGELRLCYVRPGSVRRGVGVALLAALEEQALAWNADEIRLTSTANARPFYERFGYLPDGEARPAFGVLVEYPYSKKLAR